MKSVINIIILILLSLSLYVIPLNTSTFDFENSNIFDQDKPLDKQNEYIFTKINSNNSLYNTKTYEVKIDSDLAFPNSLDKNLTYVLEFTDSQKNKTTFRSFDLGNFLFNKDQNSVTIKLDLAKAKKKLNHSTYSVNLKIKCFDKKFNDKFKLFFKKDKIVLQDNNLQNKNLFKPYFYSDKSLKFSVPIYRKGIRITNSFANVLYSLNDNPKEIQNADLIPFNLNMDYRPDMWFQNGKLRCGFSDNNLIKIKTKKEAAGLVKNLLNSYKYISDKYIINEIEFYLKSGKKDIAEFSLKEAFEIDRNPEVFLPMFMEGRRNYFWVPFSIEAGENIKDDISEMIRIYMTSPEYTGDKRFVSLLPEIKIYEKISFTDDKLIIDLSDEMYEFLSQNQIYASMIKESFSMSFATVDALNTYEIWYKDSLVENIEDVQFGQNIKPPSSFNFLK